MADPVILAYAMGMVPRFPGERSVRLDIVPVDLVANACIAAAAHPPSDGVRTFAVASGSRNPLTIGEITEMITEYFRDFPLAGEDELPVDVPDWRMKLERPRAPPARPRRARDQAGRNMLDRVAVPRVDDAERRLHKEQRRLERLRRLAEIYGPYTELDCMFDDRGARELLESLHADDRSQFDFDTEAIHWPTYIKDVHLPALRELVRPPKRGLPTVGRKPADAGLPEGPPALAVFDVEGVVLDATVVHFYAWLRGGTMPSVDRALWLALLGARVGGWVSLDRRSRASFNRAFYREYRGLPADDLRERARAPSATSSCRACTTPRCAASAPTARAATAWCSSPARWTSWWSRSRHLADELVAARLVERRGAFTGELAEPPLSADGRASLAARMAAEHGVDLAECHAYGDAISDLPLLEVVATRTPSTPTSASPARRAGAAGARRLERGAGRRSRPPAPPRWRSSAGAGISPHAPRYLATRAVKKLGPGALHLGELDPPRLPAPDWVPLRPR